ncbi:restriction endonuclease subunit S [Flavobacterium olei]|uniref:restriction endonuclease subunit S n=1 Tax=Flavobacterium olei TaxID=1886782 RepID=UPI00321BA4BD
MEVVTVLHPYTKYKKSRESWLGDIPEHWEEKKFKHVFSEKKKTTNVALNCGSISFGKVVFKDDEKIPESTKRSYQVLSKGDFLINPLNLNYDLISLRIALSDKDVVVSSGYIVLNANLKLNKEYYKWLLHIFDVQYMKTLGSGVRQTLSFTHIANCELVYPPLNEQVAIANFLNNKTAKIEQAIAIKQKQIELLKERRQILIQNAVTGGLNINVELKDTGIEWIGKIPKHWELKKLKYVLNINNGSDYKHIQTNEGYPVIGSGGQFAFATEYMYDGEVVLLGRKGTIDKPLYFNGKFWAVDTMFYANSKNGNIVKFLYFVATTIPFKFYSTATALPSMTQSDLNNHKIAIPPIEEQQKIVSNIENFTLKFDAAISFKEQEIEKLKEYRMSLIADAVSGKVRVF